MGDDTRDDGVTLEAMMAEAKRQMVRWEEALDLMGDR